jgi:hypothetical protein
MEYILWKNNRCITTKAFCWLFQSNVYNKNTSMLYNYFCMYFFSLRRMITIIHVQTLNSHSLIMDVSFGLVI